MYREAYTDLDGSKINLLATASQRSEESLKEVEREFGQSSRGQCKKEAYGQL
jgi:hypothetical protein